MLTRLKLENFKSWRNLDLELAPITLLFGTNSSGKTAILQSLLLLKQTANNFDRKQHINFGGGERDYTDFGSWRDLVYEHNENGAVRVGLSWKSPKGFMLRGVISYSILWRKYDDNVVISELAYTTGKSHLSAKASYQNRDEYLYELATETEIQTGLSTAPENGYRLSISGLLRKLAKQSDEQLRSNSVITRVQSFQYLFNDFLEGLQYIGPIRQHPQRTYLWTGSTPQTIGLQGENTIPALLASQGQDNLLVANISRWLTELGLVNEFRIEPIDRDKRFYETSVKIGDIFTSLLDVGFGVSQVLPVVTLLFFAPEGSIILLEQPELHLHPNAQAVLADLLLEVAETRNLQLIVESHSEHLLRRLQRRIAEPENAFASPENIKMYFCQIQDGESKAEEVIVDQYGQIANWPDNFFGDITGDLEAMTRAALHKAMNGDERR